jgi:hypothetical protein
VKIVYDLYFWTHPDACAKVTRGFESMEAAAAETGRVDLDRWQRVPNDNGWLLDPDMHRQRDWGIFERQEAETDSERVRLALELLANFGKEDGQHHQRWVIDQTVRILAGDGYEAWIAEYRDGEDGPETYEWDEGIAP